MHLAVNSFPMTGTPVATGAQKRRPRLRYIDGPKLLAARLRSGLTQAALGAAAGVDQNRISCLETGKRGATLTKVHALADALGVKPEDLMPAATLAAAGIKQPASKRQA